MNRLKLACIASVLTTFLAALVTAVAAEPDPGIRFVPDVVDQFNLLARRGDGLAFGVGDLPETLDISTCKHFQGMARTQAPDGTPYFIISRSGNDPGAFCVTGDDPGNLFIVRMGSRDTNGERLRSNRLRREWFPYLRDADGNLVIGPGGVPIAWTKPPDPRDFTETLVTFQGALPHYGHPGGMQMVGDVVAFGMENPYNGGPEASVMFFDMSDLTAPRLTRQFPVAGLAGVVGLTSVRNPQGAGLRYLMVTTGGDNKNVRFWRSLSTNLDDMNGPTDLKSENLDFELLLHVNEDQLEADSCGHGEDWPSGGPIRSAFGHQMINFVREGSLDGTLYAIGGRNNGIGGEGSDYLDLYRVNVDVHGNPEACPLTPVSSRHMSSFPYNGHGDSAALSAADGVYVSPSGELIVYATEYENKGPFELLAEGEPPTAGYRTVRFTEWRHMHLSRPDSPTLRPTATIAGPFTVDEGATVIVEGEGGPAITKAWLSTFEDDGAGSSLPGILDDDDWLQVDFDDREADRFDDLDLFDSTTGTEYFENAGSWRWFAPPGCTISANDVVISSPAFPGEDTVQLVGDGSIYRHNDLDSIPVHRPSGTSILMSPVPAGESFVDHDFDDDLGGVTFFHVNAGGEQVHDCAAYYDAPIGFAWDMDGNGSYETPGATAPFSAALLDGPTTATLRAQAQHPTDASPLGRGEAAAEVTILNVPPIVVRFDVLDSLGFAIGTQVPFGIAGLPVTADGAFTDPGRPDHQTASLAWGDGVVEAHGAFDQYVDAFGGATGTLRRQHLHAQPGTYAVGLTLADDDGGVTTADRSVQLLSPLDAVGAIIPMIDQAIANATSDAERTALRNARKALAGSVEGFASNGALDKLESDLINAAIVKLNLAIGELQAAQAAGADVGPLIVLLRQIVAVLEAL